MRFHCARRSGVATVELALVAPMLILLVFGLIIGGLGVFRYQETASLAREATRWASVRGATYQSATGKPAATAIDVYNNAILPNAVALDMSKLDFTVTWSPDNKQQSLVTVRITYHWIPEALLGGMDLTSTSTARISY